MRRLSVCATVGLGVAACPAFSAETDAGAAPSASAPAPAAQKPVAEQHFDIFEYVVDGNTVLSETAIEEAVYPFLGEDRTASDVDKARDALERAYRERGFQTVQVSIPQQRVESKIVHFQVIQNPVGRLRVVDSRYHAPGEIRKTASSLAEGTVPNLNAVQKDIIALNQQPDMRVTPRLKAGIAPGTVDVDLQVEDKLPLHATAEVNNQNNQKTSPLRVVGTIGYDNLWQAGHSASFTYQVAPQNTKDAQVFSASYLARIPRSEWSFLVYGVKSDSAVAALANTNVIGKGDILGARAIKTLPGTDTFYQSLTFGIDRKDLSQNVITAGVPSDAPVLYYPMSLAYAPSWRDGDAMVQGSASVNFALPGIGSNSTKFDTQRFDAQRQYFYFKTDVSRTQPLPYGMVFFGRVEGQIADGPLLSSEQMSSGGANSVRGYWEAERLGDNGLEATLELRSPVIDLGLAPILNDWRMSIFYDGAALWKNQPLPGEDDSFGLADVGLGTRFNILQHFNGALDLAFPLLDGSAARVGNPRFHFRFSAGL
jgi:hemolysin activation/secretion protein